MTLRTEWKQFESGGTTYRLYAARLERAKTPLPVVMVIQEIWGTDAHILDVAERFAKAGYLAVAPDLYAVNGERPDSLKEERIEQIKAFLNTLPPSSWHDAAAREAALEKQPAQVRDQIRETFAELFGGLTRLPEKLEILKAVMRFLSEDEESRGQKIASVGYCMGGALSVMLASAEPRLAGAVVYYGNLPAKEQVAAIQCPVAGFFGGLDERITSQVAGFAAAMEAAGKTFTSHIYEGAHHAFFNDTRPAYHVEASRDAWQKTLSFFHEVLR
ncbi:dienelactone hydrolase family protein [Brevibacillus sp. SYP-B805]|uniref:dienelactone hydrolase family protein n=1 Tax=Brevibacillus sp. SYP-B805 TaxID=1578199 RepID=UPI0013EA1852|nr:dienelactone hydrolase family protein [Brevibacillus sp. SYP-B805]NGQ95611.1 dienelactone hydrolase family protein [Brevibacillus sp. SYP-B805]